MYNAIAFPVCCFICFKVPSNCWVWDSESNLSAGLWGAGCGSTDTEASSASERSSCPLVRGDEQRLRLFKMHLHGWEYGCSTRQAVVPRTVTGNGSPMPQLTSPHTPVFKAILEFV